MSAIPYTLGAYACLDFVNSRFTDHLSGSTVIDRLEKAEWQQWFRERWRLGPVAAGPRILELKDGRETLRRGLQNWAEGKTARPADVKKLDAWLAAAAVRRRLTGEIEPVRPGWGWVLAEVVASAAELMATEEPTRLKVCANPGCTWMFWDESPNMSRRWCDPKTCGNLITVREFRRRRRKLPAPDSGDRHRSRQAPLGLSGPSANSSIAVRVPENVGGPVEGNGSGN
jgi:predicted RNA-binding Zn ribbon-like protein